MASTIDENASTQQRKYSSMHTGITVGTVVDVNDPAQLGRIRVVCPTWSDTFENMCIEEIPWAEYLSPFGGAVKNIQRGVDNNVSKGHASYGMWAIPKIGAQVAVFCKDGDPQHRVYMGCFLNNFTQHTLPRGRHMEGGVNGPLSSTEDPMEPMFTNTTTSLGMPPESEEYFTRGAENQAAAVDGSVIDRVSSASADDKSESSRKGYQVSRTIPDERTESTEKYYESQTVSITSPGAHSLIMDDCEMNERVRLVSTSGHQIIMDDTNERIYVSTAKGNNWIEMDENGNIDIFSGGRVSINSSKDVNITATESIRMSAKNIHLNSSEEIRMHSSTKTHIWADDSLLIRNLENGIDIASVNSRTRISSKEDIDITSTSMKLNLAAMEEINVKSVVGGVKVGALGDLNLFSSVGKLNMLSSSGIEIKSSSNINIDTAAEINIKSDIFKGTGTTSLDVGGDTVNIGGGSEVNVIAGTINLNSGGSVSNAGAAADAVEAVRGEIALQPNYAYTTNRVPIHEPWGRSMINTEYSDKDLFTNDIDNIISMTKESTILELPYTSVDNGKMELGVPIKRNRNWKR